MNELTSSWAFLLGRNDSPGENQRRNFSPSEFMEEYRKLRERFASTHQTADFKELHQLYEKYGISRADQLKYSRINSMLYGGKTVGGIVLGSVPATDLDELLQKGDFAGAVSRLKAGLSSEKLRELVDFPADRRSFDGYELMQWVPALAKSHLLLGGIERLGCKKRFLCKLGHTIVTADQLDLLVELRLVRSDAVAYEPALRRGSLFALGDILNDSYVFSLSFAIVSSSFS